MTRSSLAVTLVGVLLAAVAGTTWLAAYPLDGYETTGIRRLKAYRMILDGAMPGTLSLPRGALLGRNDIRLRLRDVNDSFDLPRNAPVDSTLQAGIDRIVGRRHPSYRMAILDITDPTNPRYAGVRPDEGYIPGSVGKLLVATGLFNELKKIYPNDVAGRVRILRNTRVLAGPFAMPNSHAVPVVADDFSGVTHRAIRADDVFSLWEWVDHALSPSSNAAGSVVWREAMLLREFGARYPVPPEEAAAFFRDTPKTELSDRAVAVIEDPLRELGLDTELLRLGTFFTAGASRVIPGRGSYATPRTLLRWLVKLEQGKVVDPWSSLEIKRLMYFTRRRYRYAASPALNDAAVFFKSGSLFRCVPELGYQCGQYRGNAENLMHSVAIVESPAGVEHPRVYLVSIMSNVLKVNSASEHMEIGTEIERLMSRLHSEGP